MEGDVSRPNKPLPQVPPIDVTVQTAPSSDDDRPSSPARNASSPLSNSASEIPALSPRRGTATGAVSPRLHPLLGAARNSPMMKRKQKERSESSAEVLASGSFQSPKATRLLGVDVERAASSDSLAASLPSGSSKQPSPRQLGTQTVTKEFLRDLQAYKTRTSGGGGGGDTIRGAPVKAAHSAADIRTVVSTGSLNEEYDPADSVDTLREKLEQQRTRYEKWKKEHMDDTRMKLSILTEEINQLKQENTKLKADLAEAHSQSDAWKSSYDAVKAHAVRSQTLWDEERTKMQKKLAEEMKKVEKLQKKGKPAGIPKEVSKSSIFGRGKPPTTSPTDPSAGGSPPHATATAGATGGTSTVSISEPRLVQPQPKIDSTPLPVPGGNQPQHRIRKPEDFQLVALIGQGGFGAVFLCRENATGLVCAVKRMSKAMIVKKEQVHTVNVEVNVLKEARVEGNQWIVQFHYAFSDRFYIYLAMEFCSGGDLRNLMDNVELDEQGVQFLAAEMIVSVNSLHERGYVHRDLKPSNFLISASGHLKLADFGLSKTGFSGVKKPVAADQPQAIRVFLVDDAYKTVVVNSETTVSELIKLLKMKLRIAKNAPYLLYESNSISGLARERPLAMDDRPIKVAEAWQKGLQYKFLFKESDPSRVQAMSKARVETSHRDPFFQQVNKPQRRERMYSVVGSPHYMAAEILEGSGYDAVADWWSMGCILYEMLVGAPPFTGNTAEEVFSAVLNSKDSLKFPDDKEISEAARGLIQRFLSPPKERLGYNGVGEIKQHAFFSGVNWSAVQQMTPPFEPALDDEYDCGYFESATTEGIEDMKMDDPPEGEEPLAEDPFAEGWDWSAI